MRLIRLDGWGPDGSDLNFDPHLTVILGAPAGLLGVVVRAVRALRDPAVPAPAGLVELDRSIVVIEAMAAAGVGDPVVDLRGVVHADPGALARRRAVRRIDELRSELAGVEATIRSIDSLSPAPESVTGPEWRVELEGAADELSLSMLHPHVDGTDHFCELEQRLRGLAHAADEAAIRVEATTWRIEELRSEVAQLGGPLEAAAERSVLVAELEAIRSDLLELDQRGPVASGERERLAAMHARAAVLLDELGYEDYVTFLLDDLSGAPVRDGRRDRVHEARRRILDDELARLRSTLPGEVDAHTALRERSRIQAEAAGLLGIDVSTVRRFTVTEVADLLRSRSGVSAVAGGLAGAVGRMVRALEAVGAEPPPGSGDPIELLAAARRILAGDGPPLEAADGPEGPAAADPDPLGPAGEPRGVDDLRARSRAIAVELIEAERLLNVLVEAVDRDVDSLPVGVPLMSPPSGDADAIASLEDRLALLMPEDPTSAGALPLLLLVDSEPSSEVRRLVETLTAGVQVIVVSAGVPAGWRAIGEDAGRAIEW